jgi:hypothetical protein
MTCHILLDVLAGMKLIPFHFSFNFSKIKKSAGAKSGEEGGLLISVTPF